MVKVVICADYFTEVNGGAEKTFEVLSDAVIERYGLKDNEIIKISTSKVDIDFINAHLGATWLIGNYYFLIQNNLLALFNGLNYYVVEFDYKICPTRNFEFFKHLNGEDYQYDKYAESIDTFLCGSKTTFFMSEVQKNRHVDFLKKLTVDKCKIAGSCFDDDFFDILSKVKCSNKNSVTAVYGQPTWQKGLGNAIFWCEQNGKDYVNLYNLPYGDFLSQLSKCERLVFLPNGADTAPRTVMEAKLLGLEIVMNNLVEHADEPWFNTDDLEETIQHLRSTPSRFAENIKI
tara:strand:+ start:496 stop:1362 length:867 start_codon:yes stop_codon:yes gene_type:complete